MTTTLSFIDTKGGTGKTTATMYFAAVLHNRGFTCTVVDADPQGSATYWRDRADDAGNPLPFEVRSANIRDLQRGSWETDYVLIDTPPGHGDILNAARDASDLVVVPTTPAELDVERTWATLDVMGSAPVVVLLGNVDRRSTLYRDAVDAFTDTESADDVVLLSEHIPYRTAIKRGPGTLPVSFYGYDKAVDEVLGLLAALTQEEA
ncbi:ParA family protein [Arthrobacter rhombi]|uniref:ParA family protein n=1 Tax=Arthrobacter rhombi TaxID=71253 RepID=UPI00264BEEE5|nr:ParA family protein [Micrococcaceae bacterium]